MRINVIASTNVIHVCHIKGHSMNEWNETADFLADRGATGQIASNIWLDIEYDSLPNEQKTFWNRGKALRMKALRMKAL